MKTAKKKGAARIRLPRKDAGYAELSNFFDRYDGVEEVGRFVIGIVHLHDDAEETADLRHA